MEAEIAFGKRLSPTGSLRMTLHAGSMRSERTGFSPRVPAFCCVRPPFAGRA